MPLVFYLYEKIYFRFIFIKCYFTNNEQRRNVQFNTFMMYFETQPPYERASNIYFMYDKLNVMALSTKLYAYFKEPPIIFYIMLGNFCTATK